MNGFRRVRILTRTELKAQFVSPVIYLFIAVFWVLHGVFALRVGGFFDGGEASLDGAFFWHPWLYLILVPAVGMHLWSDERRDGTLELLFTYPVTVTEAVAAKFLSALTVLLISLAGTLPLAVTVFYLGSPDPGPMICGYLGSFCVAATFLAAASFTSSLSRSHVVSFILALTLSLLLNLAGWGPLLEVFRAFNVPSFITDSVANFSVITHFETLQRGVVRLSDLLYYLSAILFFLTLTGLVLDNRRNHRFAWISGLGLCAGLIALNLIFALIPFKWDCTSGRVYSLSPGMNRILENVTSENPVTIIFYFSETHPDMPPAVRSFALRVRTLLDQIAGQNPNIRISRVNPLPDTEAEDNARANLIFGTPQPSGESVYCGLAVKCVDKLAPIPAVNADDEPMLEYQIGSAIAQVTRTENRPKIEVITSIPLIEQVASGESENSWIAFHELNKRYDVSYHLENSIYDLDLSPDTHKLVILIHPYALTDRTQYDIEQYLLRGGKVLALLDAYPFSAAVSSSYFNAPSPSRTEPWLKNWGVEMIRQPVADLALSPRDRSSGQLYIQSLPLTRAQLQTGDPALAHLSELSLYAPCGFSLIPAPGLKQTVLARTSQDGILYSLALLLDNRPIPLDELKMKRNVYALAVRSEGTFTTAFPHGCPKLPEEVSVNDILSPLPPETRHLSASVKPGETVVIGDIDFLSNRAVMRHETTAFGASVLPINDNFFFFQNLVDKMCGDTALISIRAKPPSRRPLERIEALLREAAEKRQSLIEGYEKELAKVAETVQKMTAGKEKHLIDTQTEETLRKLESRRREINRELKFQRRELRREIDALQLRLELLNTAVLPALFALLGIIVIWRRTRRCG